MDSAYLASILSDASSSSSWSSAAPVLNTRSSLCSKYTSLDKPAFSKRQHRIHKHRHSVWQRRNWTRVIVARCIQNAACHQQACCSSAGLLHSRCKMTTTVGRSLFVRFAFVEKWTLNHGKTRVTKSWASLSHPWRALNAAIGRSLFEQMQKCTESERPTMVRHVWQNRELLCHAIVLYFYFQ